LSNHIYHQHLYLPIQSAIPSVYPVHIPILPFVSATPEQRYGRKILEFDRPLHIVVE